MEKVQLPKENEDQVKKWFNRLEKELSEVKFDSYSLQREHRERIEDEMSMIQSVLNCAGIEIQGINTRRT